jgi:RHS repeat-associated protein
MIKTAPLEWHELFEKDYFKKDNQAKKLTNSILEFDGAGIDIRSISEAYRAMRGQVLRQEVYGLDGSTMETIPYTVTESNVKVRLEQPKGTNEYAVYYSYPNESIQYYYERIKDDPRIEHTFNLKVDAFGNILKSAKVNYPRRISAYPEQQQTRGILSLNRIINETENFHLIGVPCEQKVFEIGGLDAKANQGYFSLDDLQQQISQAENTTIPFDQQLPLDQKHLRLLSWQRNYFWNESQDNALQLGKITQRALPHHSETAVFPTSLIQNIFGSKITKEDLAQNGGYVEQEGYWWNPGTIQYFYSGSENRFFLPNKTKDPFGAETIISQYDNWLLFPKRVVDPLQNVTQAEIDYHTLQPQKLIDLNDNVSEVLLDPLGLVVAFSVYGEENGKIKGDLPLDQYKPNMAYNLAEILQHPQDYIQGASNFFFYDLHVYRKGHNQAVYSVNIMRETHARDLQSGETSELQYHINFSDGFGREIQKKLKVEPGEAYLRDSDGRLKLDADGKAVLGQVNERWLVSGRTVYNNKAKPVKQYEPFYSQTANYESEKEVTDTGVTPIIHYDPLSRVVRTDTPKGFFSKTEFTPWMEKVWDRNDTVLDSDYYLKKDDTSPREKSALEKAAKHYNTPEVNALNNLGQRFLTIEENLNGHKLFTHYKLDIQGNEVTITDPRQVELNKDRPPDKAIKNFVHAFDMNGTPLSITSIDAGLRLTLNNALEQPFYYWNSRNFHVHTTYDLLQRPTEVRVVGNGLDQIVEKFKYGEGGFDDKSLNLRGQLIEHYDQAGLLKNTQYDIKGALCKSSRRLRKNYKSEVNWSVPQNELLEDESLYTEITYDALGRIKKQTYPSQNETDPKNVYYPTFHQSGLLKSLDIIFSEGTIQEIVKEINYNAKGQRKKIRYGNGVVTKHKYEDETFRLKSIYSYFHEGTKEKELQNITYTYDPVGNITQIKDESIEAVFFKNQKVNPQSEYTYDGLYRLIEAKGRSSIGLTGKEYKDRTFKQSHYIPIQPNGINQLENYRRGYTYDDSGNLIEIRHISSSSQRTIVIVPSKVSNRAVPNDMLQASNASPEDFFDANGNMKELDHSRKIEWDYRDNIASATLIERGDGQVDDREYYIYDSAGQRIRKVSERLVNGETGAIEIEEKIYLGNYEIKRIQRRKQDDSTSRIILERETFHAMDDQQRVALIHRWNKDDLQREVDIKGTRKVHFQLNNHLGSSAMELTEKTELISYEEYFPYGGTALISGKKEKEVKLKEYRYSGKERDDFTGLYYYGARYYASWMGRWVSCDPIGKGDGLNLFVFIQNNPMNLMDDFGLAGEKVTPEIEINWNDIEDHFSNEQKNGRFDFQTNVGSSSHKKPETVTDNLDIAGKKIPRQKPGFWESQLDKNIKSVRIHLSQNYHDDFIETWRKIAALDKRTDGVQPKSKKLAKEAEEKIHKLNEIFLDVTSRLYADKDLWESFLDSTSKTNTPEIKKTLGNEPEDRKAKLIELKESDPVQLFNEIYSLLIYEYNSMVSSITIPGTTWGISKQNIVKFLPRYIQKPFRIDSVFDTSGTKYLIKSIISAPPTFSYKYYEVKKN